MTHKANIPPQHPQRFIKLPEVRALTTLSTSEIYRRIAAGTFPTQVRLSSKSSAWVFDEVVSWCKARMSERREKAL